MLQSLKKAACGIAVGMGLLVGTQPATANKLSGSVDQHEIVLSHDTDVYRVTFRGGETASILVIGDGDTDLDLYVYDQFGRLVASDADLSDNCLVMFTPRWTGQFTIRIVNRGGVYNRYHLMIR